jgi:hypothetical protein
MKPFQKWLLWSSSAAAALTGILADEGDPGADRAVGGDQPPAPAVDAEGPHHRRAVLVRAVGLVTIEHNWKHIRASVARGRRSGLLAAAPFVPIVLSGYLVDVSNRVVAYYESEGAQPPGSLVVDLALALEVTTDELLSVG